jgi:hypothetical protein
LTLNVTLAFSASFGGIQNAYLYAQGNNGFNTGGWAQQGTWMTAALQSITVSPNSASIQASLTQQFTATGHFQGGASQNLTAAANWSSSNNPVATVSNAPGTQGLATGVAVGGPATITASLGTISGTAQLTVTTPNHLPSCR